MEQKGEVVEVKDGLLTVQFCRPEACENCRACTGEQNRASIQIPGDAQVGDQVTVSMPDGQVAKASLLAYMMPLCALMAGLLIGGALGGELFAALGAAVGLAASLAVLKLLDGRLRKDAKWTPQIVDVQRRQP